MATRWRRYWESWAKIPLAYYGRNAIEVDLNDLRPADNNNICDVLGCDGPLHLHFADKQFRIRYLVGLCALVFWGEVRNGISQKI